MSLQTTVLVNGTWATRTVDIGELLSRNRESDNTSGNPERCKPPATGLLSRTLIQGPAVQWILPARLRHQDQNDVVFIGDKFIQIKELVPSGHLEEVVTKADFDSRIIGAKIINSRPGPGLEDEIKQGGRVPSHSPRPSLLGERVPPHILVLVLSSKEILFIFTKEGPQGYPEFVYSRRPLPADTSALEEYGRHIAVEPRSRAMAICAAQKFFGVFALKPSSNIQTEMATGTVNPIQEFDDIYLCREDGMVIYLEIGKSGDIERQSNLGSLGCNLDTAFAILPEGYQAGDVLVTAGSMCGGGLFIEDARKPPRCIQRIPNWGPILDTAVIKATTHMQPKGSQQEMGLSFDRIFTCSGVGPDHGTISELRYGIEAQIGLSIEHGACSSITGVWGIPVPKAEGTLCLLTDPMLSSLIFIPVSGTEEGFAMDEERSGLDLDHQTLAAGITSEGVVIQVTDASIRLSHVGIQQRSATTWEDPNDRAIIAFTSGARSLVAIAMRNGTDIRVELRKVKSDETGSTCALVGLPLALTQEPICFAIEELGGQLYLLIGTGEGKILVIAINGLDGLTPYLEQGMVMGKDDIDSPPEKMQPVVDVFGCVDAPSRTPLTGLSGSLLCIAENTLFACSLERVAKAVPREIRVRGNPKRLVYSEYLNKIIVAYNRVDFDFTPSTEGTKRWIWPKIGFLDPNGEAIISAPIDLRATGSDSSPPTVLTRQPVGGSGEKITALLDWRFFGDGNEYHMIVVGTAYPQARYKKSREVVLEYKGRVVYITVRQSPPGTGNIDCMTKRIHKYDQPVRAVAAFGPSSLVVAYGDDIMMQTLNPSTRQWRNQEPHRLESHAVSISVKEPYVYVLTSRHSLCILEATQDGLALYGQAGADKGGLDHVNLLGDTKITFTANRGGALVGLSEIGLMDDKLLQPVFSAYTPSAVVRVSRSFRPGTRGSGTSYGTTLDGTLYRFQTLTEHEWRILRFIQTSCVGDANICPFRRKRRMLADELGPSLEKPEYMHVDGDILARLTRRGAKYLEEMMRRNPPDGVPMAHAEKKVERFLEFARLVVGDTKDPFMEVTSWMENLLRVEI
ncbi:thermotolerance protein [Arthroderma uncinatum]|uniref:thermotolerance protein n=1 Tax=Arthroderma uncinatum TaxID=74035 RepID=UPI00144A9E3F|nr:thermotolerance protein [Arthroderma uncinatum]KAF3482970.1 thermotolerance protein [Arthroderma uncinatum]